jgi:hypothetical protein
MTASFRLTPNVAKGSDTLTLEVQGFSKSTEYQAKVFNVQICELDAGQDYGNAGSKNDVLAEFSAEIINTGSKDAPKLFFDKVKRTDTFTNTIPPAPPRHTAEGDLLSFVPEWTPPHFRFVFATSAGSSAPFLILIQGETGEREAYKYEIGFKILSAGTVVYDSGKSHTSLDCCKLLATNCKSASLALYNDHREMVAKRGIGTYYGSNYSPDNAAKFAKQKTDFHIGKISCIEYLLEAGKKGHEKSLAIADWKLILNSLDLGKGTTLAKGLEKIGWSGIYYNLDTENPMDKNYVYNTKHYSWTEHSFTYRIAKSKRRYYELVVHDMIINFRPTEKYWDGTPVQKITTKDSTKISKLKKIPFGFLNARGGEHTAIVMSGSVYEVHFSRGPDELELFAISDFETQWGWPWLTGIIHVPPGLWE